MLIDDHFVITVARRIGADRVTGPYHEHHMSIDLQRPAVSNRREAIERLAEVCKHYPEPEFRCTLTQVVCRGILVADSEELFAPA